MKRKPQPGRCGICGQAVPFVRKEKPVAWGCVSGHYYNDGKLEKVRCHLHVDKNDTRTPGYGWG